MEKYSISIIIPTYCQNTTYLEAAIKSAINQSYQNKKIIIADDQGPIDTEEVAESFENQQILYFRNPRNLGMFANCDYAIRNYTDSDFIFLLCQDDYLIDPDYLQRVMNRFNEGEASVALAGYRNIYTDGRPYHDHLFNWEEEITEGNLLFENFWKNINGKTQDVPWITLVFSREEFIKRCPLYRPELISNDLVLPLTMLIGEKAYLENKAIIAYRVHELSYSGLEGQFDQTRFEKSLEKMEFIQAIMQKAKELGLSDNVIKEWHQRIQSLAYQGKVDEIYRLCSEKDRNKYFVQLKKKFPEYTHWDKAILKGRFRNLKQKIKQYF